MNITLYKAADELRHLLDNMDDETGELPEGYETAREIVTTKSRAVAAYIAQSEHECDMVEEHAKALLIRVKTARARSLRLRQYLAFHMKETGLTAIKSDDGMVVKLLVDRDESVEVYEPGLLPADYMREIPAKSEPDKTLIKKALKDGFEVQGARIVKKDRLEIK